MSDMKILDKIKWNNTNVSRFRITVANNIRNVKETVNVLLTILIIRNRSDKVGTVITLNTRNTLDIICCHNISNWCDYSKHKSLNYSLVVNNIVLFVLTQVKNTVVIVVKKVTHNTIKVSYALYVTSSHTVINIGSQKIYVVNTVTSIKDITYCKRCLLLVSFNYILHWIYFKDYFEVLWISHFFYDS